MDETQCVEQFWDSGLNLPSYAHNINAFEHKVQVWYPTD